MLTHALTSPQRPARTVLLGGNGFIGQVLAANLRAEDVEVISLGSKDLDLASPGAASHLQGLLRPTDSLVMLSALTPDRGRGIDTFMANLRMAEAVCAALAQAPVAHVVYFSSDAVYPLDRGLVDESSPAAPVDLYGAMHRSRELMLAQACGDRLCILRPTLVYGAGDSHNSYGPNRFRRQAAQGPITLGGEGEETRDHLNVRDLAELVMRVLFHRSRGLLNLATGRSVSFATVAQRVAGCFTPPAEVRFTPRTGPITHRAFDITALLKAFPGFVFTPLDAGLAEAHGKD